MMPDADEPIWTETESLLRYLDRLRDSIVGTTEGLTDEQLRSSTVPSGTNLLGLLHHLTGVEAHWFVHVFLAEGGQPDMAMTAPAGVTQPVAVARYRAACRRSNEIVRSVDLATLAAGLNPGEDAHVSLRRITAHMIEETGRHAGHADILREQIDGATDL